MNIQFVNIDNLRKCMYCGDEFSRNEEGDLIYPCATETCDRCINEIREEMGKDK